MDHFPPSGSVYQPSVPYVSSAHGVSLVSKWLPWSASANGNQCPEKSPKNDLNSQVKEPYLHSHPGASQIFGSRHHANPCLVSDGSDSPGQPETSTLLLLFGSGPTELFTFRQDGRSSLSFIIPDLQFFFFPLYTTPFDPLL